VSEQKRYYTLRNKLYCFMVYRSATLNKVKTCLSMSTYIAIGLLLPRGGYADSFTLQTALNDTTAYFTAPVRWDGEDWLYFGAALTAVAASHQFDSRVRTHFATGSYAVLDGKDRNSLRDALPTVSLIAGTWAGAWLTRDSDGYRETWALVEAATFSTATSEVLSLAAGRERPDATTSPDRWRQGADSFPSLHTSAAFSVGMVFAESGNDDYRWIRRIIGYGVAGATSYIRVRENVHWLSDTVAGAALGIATARFVLNRVDAESRASFQFQPVKDGWQLSYSVRTP
jgi:membrane-associated phospholipid phosphatase